MIDRLEPSQQPREAADWILGDGGRQFRRVFVGARDGLGLDVLREAIADAAMTPHLPTGSPQVRFDEPALDEPFLTPPTTHHA
jgi:hypothetical protein